MFPSAVMGTRPEGDKPGSIRISGIMRYAGAGSPALRPDFDCDNPGALMMGY